MFNINKLRNQVCTQIQRTIFLQTRSKAKFKDGGEHATLNDLPIPEGSWKEAYSRAQTGYMIVLFSGLAAFIGSVLYVAKSGKMEMNYSVPDYPYEVEEEQ